MVPLRAGDLYQFLGLEVVYRNKLAGSCPLILVALIGISLLFFLKTSDTMWTAYLHLTTGDSKLDPSAVHPFHAGPEIETQQALLGTSQLTEQRSQSGFGSVDLPPKKKEDTVSNL